MIALAVLALLVAAHWYLYRRLVRDTTRARGPGRRAGTILIVLLAVLTGLLLVAGPLELPYAPRRLGAIAAAVWLPLLLYLVLALLVGEAVRPLLGRSRPAADPSRRLFVARTVAVGATVVAAGVTGAGALIRSPRQRPEDGGVRLALPFTGLWVVQNSPARQVPSHGTDLLGGRYAIDFVAVDDRWRTAGHRDWLTFLDTERPDIFYAFGRPILAPADGTVVAVHDGEPDHEARRSQTALLSYTLGQGARLRRGVPAVAGNHVVIALADGAFVGLAHFRSGSVRVAAGQRVTAGEHIADCGNSGNSTQPHVHIQAMDSADLTVARGLPMVFRSYREWPAGPDSGRVQELAIPANESIVESLG